MWHAAHALYPLFPQSRSHKSPISHMPKSTKASNTIYISCILTKQRSVTARHISGRLTYFTIHGGGETGTSCKRKCLIYQAKYLLVYLVPHPRKAKVPAKASPGRTPVFHSTIPKTSTSERKTVGTKRKRFAPKSYEGISAPIHSLTPAPSLKDHCL